ncbi:MAG: UDP-N-acetylmuramoyl-L-alanyl-D-glutamate--2,6-diaminopimelate ligase, partial [Pseudomonadota bacterium]|nr:UDP-N-acetylmuramoyl-L-alanyl-D-glutamate--2,6-diaminopimelate ligase [Pseudomonadota bacterium]
MMGIRERKMKLAELLSPWIENIEMDIEISGIESDSRQVMPGMLFLAAQAPFDHVQRYIDEAIQKGAVAIIYDTDELPIASVPAFRLSKLCELFGPIASRFYGYPTHELNVIGVTGTNGKTTISYLLTQA